jgi:hypothetical protein
LICHVEEAAMTDGNQPKTPAPPGQPPQPSQQPAQPDEQQPWYQNPAAPVPGQPAQQPPAPRDDEAFGFEAAPKEEKYNTEYLVRNMERDRKRSLLIVVAIVIAALLGVVTWVLLAPEEPSMPAPSMPATAPPTPATEKTPAETSAADEAAGAPSSETDNPAK